MKKHFKMTMLTDSVLTKLETVLNPADLTDDQRAEIEHDAFCACCSYQSFDDQYSWLVELIRRYCPEINLTETESPRAVMIEKEISKKIHVDQMKAAGDYGIYIRDHMYTMMVFTDKTDDEIIASLLLTTAKYAPDCVIVRRPDCNLRIVAGVSYIVDARGKVLFIHSDCSRHAPYKRRPGCYHWTPCSGEYSISYIRRLEKVGKIRYGVYD